MTKYQMTIDYCDGKGARLVGNPTEEKEILDQKVNHYNMANDYSFAKVVEV